MCVCVPATCVLIVLLERCLGVSGGIFWPSPSKWGRICSLGLFRRAPFPQYSYLAHDTWVESPWLSVSVHREPVFSPPAFISSVLADYPSPVLTFSRLSRLSCTAIPGPEFHCCVPTRLCYRPAPHLCFSSIANRKGLGL